MIRNAIAALAGAAIFLSGAASGAPTVKKGMFQTNDGYTLNYLEAGKGRVIVMIPGWSQSAEQFREQMALAYKYRVIALDIRGHGDSSKGRHGYRLHRLSKDLHDFLVSKDLRRVTLLGHSLGAAVIWGYWDLYRDERVSKLIFVDQVPACANNPGWTEEQKKQAGGLWDNPKDLYDMANSIGGPEGEKISSGFVADMFTKAFPKQDVNWVVGQNLKFPREPAARLLVNHCMTDWRDVFPTITLPTLIVGARGSFFKVEALEWERQQIPGARLEVFGAEEGGSHFMFMENPAKFNKLVRDFVQ